MAKIGPKEEMLRAMRAAPRQKPKRESFPRMLTTAELKTAQGLDDDQGKHVGFPKIVHDSLKTKAAQTAAATQEETVKTTKPKKKAKAARKKKTKPKATKAAVAKVTKPASSAKAPVPAQDVADFISRPVSEENPLGGASMDELVAQFGIEPHPMRAKIFYVRHTLKYAVKPKDGRYYGTPPKAKAAKKK